MARTPRLPLIMLVCAAMATAGCSMPFGTSPDSAADPGRSAHQSSDSTSKQSTRFEGDVVWRDCADVPKKLVGRTAAGMTYQCTTINVPRDWLAPNAKAVAGGTAVRRWSGPSTSPAPASPGTDLLEVALIRVRAESQSKRIGSLVINPGGPGASGIDTAVYLSFGSQFGGMPEDITRRFDLVGFDPRGVGRSTPVDCVSDTDFDALFSADPDPKTQAAFDKLLATNRRVATGCARKYGDRLGFYSTEQSARDMDAVRAAVGDEKMTYLGYSYGTLLGATYAQLFPDKIRAFVLDGAVDPKADSVSASESQARGFEKAFGNFAAWCRGASQSCPIGPDARASLLAALDKARVSPAASAGGRKATSGWIFWAVVSSLYTRSGWEELAKALDKLADGDPSGVFKLADQYVERDASGRYDTMFDSFFAINCADDGSNVTPERARTLQAEWRKKYPIFGAALATEMLTCSAWPAKRDPYPTGEAKGAPPIVVVGTTGDPATPYEQTARLAKMLGVGRVLTNEGEGHTAYPDAGCVTKMVNAYLLELKVPNEPARCPAG